MNLKARTVTLLAAAALVGSSIAPAFATPPPPPPTTTVLNVQIGALLGIADNNPNNESTIYGGSFNNAAGNITANAAAGNANEQSSTSYVQNGSSNNFASTSVQGLGLYAVGGDEAQIHAIGNNANAKNQLNDDSTSNNNASINQSFESTGGTVTANHAAGDLNQQSSIMAVSAGALNNVSAQTWQVNLLALVDSVNQNYAVIDQSFQGATGDIVANQAAGNANQQSATLIVAGNP